MDWELMGLGILGFWDFWALEFLISGFLASRHGSLSAATLLYAGWDICVLLFIQIVADCLKQNVLLMFYISYQIN